MSNGRSGNAVHNARTSPVSAQRADPWPAYKYFVEIQGIIVAQFTECGGLSVERDIFPYEEGGVNDHIHQLPGRVKQSRITLKRGLTDSKALWNWCQTGLYDGRVKRVNLSISLYSVDGTKLKHWDLIGAFPVKWSGSNLESGSNQAIIETLEIVHEGLSLQ